MAHLSRIRTSRKQPMSAKRKRELVILAENNMMTEEHFKSWKRGEDATNASFMDEAHMLRCDCGQNKKATIIESVDLGWIVSTKGQVITKSVCPGCSPQERRKLEKDISAFYGNRRN